MRRLTLAQADELRRTPGATVALFLTDRCPVGCGHCSVGSRPGGPTIADWPLFTEIVAGICALDSVQAVAITGGEPFAERRGLSFAVERLHAAGKAVVVFTSGYWARDAVPAWIAAVLGATSTVYLSTDSFHTNALRAPGTTASAGPSRAAAAVRAVEAAGCHLILHVLDEPGAAAAARALSRHAELRVISPLATGRGAGLFPRPAARPVSAFGPCALLNSPTVRYDGVVTACCNEAVITGAGPSQLRRRVIRRADVGAALKDLRSGTVLRLMAALGPAALASVVDGPFRTVCEPCWAAHERVAADPRAAAMVALLDGRR